MQTLGMHSESLAAIVRNENSVAKEDQDLT